MRTIGSLTGQAPVPEPNPFAGGQEAAKQGQAISVSPYKKNSREWVRWLSGYQYQRNVQGQPAALEDDTCYTVIITEEEATE